MRSRRRELVALPAAPLHASRAQATLWIVVAVLVAVLFSPTLQWLARSWQVHPYYTHGMLLIPVAGWFIWRDRSKLTREPAHDAGFVLVATGVLIHLAALWWAAYPVSAAGLLVLLAGLAMLAGGIGALRVVSFPLLLLALAIPLPYIERLAPPLAGAVARSAVLAAGSIGTGVVQAGAQLTVGDGSFTVGAPCSGLRSLLALSTLAVVMAGVIDGPKWSRVALVALAVPVALAANWLRLTGFIWLADWSGADQALSMYHSLSSPILIVCCTLALLSIGAVTGCHVRVRA